MEFNEILKNELSDATYHRNDSSRVHEALEALGVSPSSFFVGFFSAYKGPFWSEKLGFELLDLIEDSPNIVEVTQACRQGFSFSDKYLALCELSAGQVFVLDCESDGVYAVNFEGGETLLKDGKLEIRWKNFKGFIENYF